MPDVNGQNYVLVGYVDERFGKQCYARPEGRVPWIGDQANDKISSFAIDGSNVDPDDWEDLKRNPNRIRLVAWEDANFGKQQWDFTGQFQVVGTFLGIENVGDDANDEISSLDFSVEPAPPARLAAARAAKRRQQDQARRTQTQTQADQAEIDLQQQIDDQTAELERLKRQAELKKKQDEIAAAKAALNNTTVPPPVPAPGTNTGGGSGASAPGGLEVYAVLGGQGVNFDQAVNAQGQVTAGATFLLLGFDAGDGAQGFKLSAGPAAQLGAQKFPGQTPQTYGLQAWVATQTSQGPRLLTAATMNSLFGSSWKR